MRHGDSEPMAFFGHYTEVTPHSRLVWTNEEGGADGPVTTLTLEEKAGQTVVVLHDLYPSKEALDAAMASGEKSGMSETFEQLDELLVTLGASLGQRDEVVDLAVRPTCCLLRRGIGSVIGSAQLHSTCCPPAPKKGL